MDGELELKTEPAIFRTTSLVKVRKDIFSVENLTDNVDISWSKAECGEWRVKESESETNVTFYNKNELEVCFDSPDFGD